MPSPAFTQARYSYGHIAMAYIVMTYIVMVYIIMAARCRLPLYIEKGVIYRARVLYIEQGRYIYSKGAIYKARVYI